MYLFHTNYPAILTTLKDLLTDWKHHLISWLRRITAFETTLLPKFLYYFSVLLVQISPHCVLFSSQDPCFYIGRHKVTSLKNIPCLNPSYKEDWESYISLTISVLRKYHNLLFFMLINVAF